MDTLAIIVAAIGAAGTAVATVYAARARVQADNVVTLTTRVSRLEERTNYQDSWIFAARMYIATLRGTLADRGIQSPAPPEELRLHLREGDDG